MITIATSTIDLTSVTGGLSDVALGVLAAAALVITAGLSLGAVKFGGKWAYKVFKSFTS